MVKMRRSTFRMQPRNTFTCDMGYCVPIFCKETLPGDTWRFSINDAIRMVPMLAPQYTDISVSVMAFKVATRTIWKDFEQFRTGGKNNDDTTEAPYMVLRSSDSRVSDFSTLADYLGIPVLQFWNINPATGQPTTKKDGVGFKVSALPFRAYAKVWNEWLRVEHVQDEVTVDDGNGLDNTTNVNLLKRRWNRDYFTSLLPDQQLGPQAYLPIALTAPVYSSQSDNPDLIIANESIQPQNLKNKDVATMRFRPRFDQSITPSRVAMSAILSDRNYEAELPGEGTATAKEYILHAENSQLSGTNVPLIPVNLKADLSSSSSVSWSQVRLTAKMQQVGERLMLGGARMPEFLMSFFGVRSSDARLDRSEYLGGFTSDVHISPIMQTSSTDATSPQGNQAAVAYHVSGTRTFKTFCEEDGWILVLMSIRPRTVYAQGLHKQWQRWTRYDYMNPMFAHLSLEPVKNSEIYLQGVELPTPSPIVQPVNWDDPSLPDNQAFGFKPMYQEYRTFPNEIHGDMLNHRQHWNMARIFEYAPSYNDEFVECTPTKRPFAYIADGSAGNVCLCETMLNIKLSRVLPKVGTPRF